MLAPAIYYPAFTNFMQLQSNSSPTLPTYIPSIFEQLSKDPRKIIPHLESGNNILNSSNLLIVLINTGNKNMKTSTHPASSHPQTKRCDCSRSWLNNNTSRSHYQTIKVPQVTKWNIIRYFTSPLVFNTNSQH